MLWILLAILWIVLFFWLGLATLRMVTACCLLWDLLPAVVDLRSLRGAEDRLRPTANCAHQPPRRRARAVGVSDSQHLRLLAGELLIREHALFV